MPTPGRLQQRPGTVEFASKVVLAAPPATDPEGPDDAPVPRGTFDTTLPGDTGWLVEPTNVSPHPVAQIAGTDKWGTVVEDTVVFEISF